MVKTKIILSLACTLTCFVVTGCYSCSPEAVARREAENNATRAKALAKWEKKISTLKIGSSVQNTQKAFGSKGVHEFTIQKNSSKYVCLSFLVGKKYSWSGADYAEYHCIFEGGRLYAIVEPPAFECEIKIDEKDCRISYRKPIISEKRVEAIFSAKNLIGMELTNSFQKNFPRRESCSNLGPIIPLMMVLGPMSVVANSAGYLLHSIEINRLENKYNPQKISIGMSPDEVDSIFGKPIRSYHPTVDRIIRIYGLEDSIDGYNKYGWKSFLIELKNSSVIGIYSNDFCNKKMMQEN